jgi:hypothetical protein
VEQWAQPSSHNQLIPVDWVRTSLYGDPFLKIIKKINHNGALYDSSVYKLNDGSPRGRKEFQESGSHTVRIQDLETSEPANIMMMPWEVKKKKKQRISAPNEILVRILKPESPLQYIIKSPLTERVPSLILSPSLSLSLSHTHTHTNSFALSHVYSTSREESYHLLLLASHL